MSYYYNYYLGQRNKSIGTVSFLGPFSKEGGALPILWKSRSFASDLHESFDFVPKENIDSSIFENKILYKDDDYQQTLKMLPLSELKNDSPFKIGYVLRSQLISFFENKDNYFSETDAFTKVLTAEAFATFAQGYLVDEKPMFIYDWNSHETIKALPTDFVYHSWINYNSPEYEKWFISEVINNLGLSYRCDKDSELVILETEG